MKPKRSLIGNITSEYLEASAKLRRRERVLVYVEGYEDVAFWKSILRRFETPTRVFEVSPPSRGDMAKGKKVVLGFADKTGPNMMLCVDSDFDYIFGDRTDQSRIVNGNKYVIQTYTYAIENLLCYPPSLDTIVVKATKNDNNFFDFVKFFERYSTVIYPAFLWYLTAAEMNDPGIYPLIDFRNTVKLNYLDTERNGAETIDWVQRQVERRVASLEQKHGNLIESVNKMDSHLKSMNITPQSVHMYMQGHTLMDNVAVVVLESVCDVLRQRWVNVIMGSDRRGQTLKNELSYYNNSLRDIETLLQDNTLFEDSDQFKLIIRDIEKALKSSSS